MFGVSQACQHQPWLWCEKRGQLFGSIKISRVFTRWFKLPASLQAVPALIFPSLSTQFSCLVLVANKRTQASIWKGIDQRLELKSLILPPGRGKDREAGAGFWDLAYPALVFGFHSIQYFYSLTKIWKREPRLRALTKYFFAAPPRRPLYWNQFWSYCPRPESPRKVKLFLAIVWSFSEADEIFDAKFSWSLFLFRPSSWHSPTGACVCFYSLWPLPQL